MQTDPWTLGIATGVLSSILFLGLSKFFSIVIWNIVLPATVIRYDGINLEAIWKNEIKTSKLRTNEGKLVLKQRGKWLRGKMTLLAKEASSHDETVYRIKGKIINGFVKLEAWPENNIKLGFSAGIFRIEKNGSVLRGSSVFVDNFTSNIGTHNDFAWVKD